MDVRVGKIARRHDGLVTWQAMRAAGMSERQARVAVADLRRMHDGVFLTGHSRVTMHQRWLAATLTAPGTVLSHDSAGQLHRFRPARHRACESVTRSGNGGPQRIGGLLVYRSSSLNGEFVTCDGIAVTSPTRTLIDLSAQLNEVQRAKAVREGIRLKAFNALEVRLAAARYRGRRGTSGLADLAARLEKLPIARTRSDAEARALEVLDAAGLPAPRVNVRFGGEEADLSWSQSRRILEIDGRQFHEDQLEDERKEAVWRSDGWTVERVSSDVVFDAPEKLVEQVKSWANVEGPSRG